MSEENTTVDCPECEQEITIPLDTNEGEVTCSNCNSSYYFGKKDALDGPTMEMANKYAMFIAPTMIILNEKVLEFNDFYPDNGLFDPETLEKTRATIEDLKQMLEEDGKN